MVLDVCTDRAAIYARLRDCKHEHGAILECGGVLGNVTSDIHCRKCGSYIGLPMKPDTEWDAALWGPPVC